MRRSRRRAVSSLISFGLRFTPRRCAFLARVARRGLSNDSTNDGSSLSLKVTWRRQHLTVARNNRPSSAAAPHHLRTRLTAKLTAKPTNSTDIERTPTDSAPSLACTDGYQRTVADTLAMTTDQKVGCSSHPERAERCKGPIALKGKV